LSAGLNRKPSAEVVLLKGTKLRSRSMRSSQPSTARAAASQAIDPDIILEERAEAFAALAANGIISTNKDTHDGVSPFAEVENASTDPTAIVFDDLSKRQGADVNFHNPHHRERFEEAVESCIRIITGAEPGKEEKVFSEYAPHAIQHALSAGWDKADIIDRLENAGVAIGLDADSRQRALSDGILRANPPATDPAAPKDHTSADDTGQQSPIHATPFVWKRPSTIPRREWLYGHLLLRKFVTATISPGGIGKSSLIAAEAMAMASGKTLLGVSPVRPLRVWLWNLEDPREETERKIYAAALHYDLSPDDIGDRLLVDSGREQRLVIAKTTRTGAVIVHPVVESIVAEIIKHQIDVIIVDPFVSCHEVAENDNSAMDMVVKEWGRVADRGNCSVHLVHHTRKMGDVTEVTAESSRGGSAQTDACRVVRVVNRMTKQEATAVKVENPRLYLKTYNDKANLTPPAEGSDWYKLVSVDLGNGPTGMPGDCVGVVAKWEWPDLTIGMTADDYDKVAAAIKGGQWKASSQAKNWAGIAFAEALGLDVSDEGDKAKIKAALKMYLKAKTLVEVARYDNERREQKMFIEVAAKV
jgi:AAA domain